MPPLEHLWGARIAIGQEFQGLKQVPRKYNYWLEERIEEGLQADYLVKEEIVCAKRWEAIRPALILAPEFTSFPPSPQAEALVYDAPPIVYATPPGNNAGVSTPEGEGGSAPAPPDNPDLPSGTEGEAMPPPLPGAPGIPGAPGVDLQWLGWETPGGDRQSWQKHRTRRFEFLYLLRSLTEPSGMEAQSKAAAETGIGYLPGFLEAAEDLGERNRFFHGQYQYTPLMPPPVEGLPSRVLFACRQLSLTPETDLSLIQYMAVKDAFMFDLLQIALSNEDAFNWFCAAARWYPFFTKMRPEATASGAVQVFRARVEDSLEGQPYFAPHSRFQDLENRVDETFSKDRKNAFFHAVYRHQIEYMDRNRNSWRPPVNGWSGWIAKTNPRMEQEKAEPETLDIAPDPVADETGDGAMAITCPERAWPDICRWIREGPYGNGYYYTLTNETGWGFAFGLWVLNDENEGNERDLPECNIAVAGLSAPDGKDSRLMTIRLEGEGGPRAVQQFRIDGPWKPWFAYEKPRLWMFVALSLALAILLLATGLLVRRWLVHGDRASLVYGPAFFAMALGVFVTILLLSPPFQPKPARSLEIGGDIEFAVPAGGDVSKGLADTCKELCLGFFQSIMDDDGLSEGDENARIGFWQAVRAACWCTRDREMSRATQVAPSAGRLRLTQLRYRITPNAFGPGVEPATGFVRAQNCEQFLRQIDTTLHSGIEHRLPPPSTIPEPALPGALVHGPGSNVRFALLLTAGGHGALEPMDTPPPSPSMTLRHCVHIPEPARDPRPALELTLGQQSQWLAERSDSNDTLLADGASEEQLLAPPRPADMAQKRRQYWSGIYDGGEEGTMSAAWKDKVAQAAAKARNSFRSSAEWGSRSTLRIEGRWPLFLLIGVALLLLLRRSVFPKLVLAFGIPLYLLFGIFCAAAICTWMQPGAPAYGASPLAAMPYALDLPFFIGAIVVAFSLLYDYRRHRPEETIGAKESPQAALWSWLPRACVRARLSPVLRRGYCMLDGGAGLE